MPLEDQCQALFWEVQAHVFLQGRAWEESPNVKAGINDRSAEQVDIRSPGASKLLAHGMILNHNLLQYA